MTTDPQMSTHAVWGHETPHTLTEFGTTNCPVERVRAFVDDDVCSACGAEVTA